MAFPAIAATNTTNGTTASTTATVNLPATPHTQNSLLIAALRTADGTSAHTWPADWTQLFDTTADAADDRFSCYYRWANGIETSSTISVTQSNAKYAAISWRITGAQNPATTAPQISTIATGTSTAPDPTSVTPSGGTQDYLFIWLGSWEGEQTSPPTGTPTNYVSAVGADSGTAGVVATNVRVATASRQLNTGAAQDPGSWTISASDDWSAYVVCIHPSTAEANLPIVTGLPPISPDWGY